MLRELTAFLLGAAAAWTAASPTMSEQDASHDAHVERPARPASHARKPARKGDDFSPMGPATVTFKATLRHVHTREHLGVGVDAPASEVSRFLRCRATGSQHPIAAPLVPLAVRIANDAGANVLDVVSGFRSPKLNELLRKKGRQVASDSQHTHGTALDFKVPGVDAVTLARRATALHQGGIGTYRHSGFIHVDVGRPRRWNGR